MQLKALHLGIMTLAGAVLLALTLPTPRAAAQAADGPAISSEREAEQVRIQRAVLDVVRHVGKARERKVRNLRWRYASSASREYLESQIAWIEKIESGDPRVMYETALRLRDGGGLPQHRDAAVTWLERAGDHGVPEGLFEASRMLLNNPIRDGDIRRSDDLLRRAARKGVAEAQKVLGLQLASGGARPNRRDRDREDEYRDAYMWLLLAEANGADVGDIFARDSRFLSEQELKMARAILERAAGRILPRYWPAIEGGGPEDWWDRLNIALRWHECERAISILNGAAQDGETEAELELARSYERGTCVEVDAAKALAHYEAAAKSGDTRAILRVGFMYYDGRGAPKDLQTASQWFKAAALNLVDESPRQDRRMEALERNLPGADAFRARAIPPELAAEIDWLSEIERGDPRVMYETALRLRDGDGLPQHRDAALIWLERAGDHGVPEGFHAAARMLLDELDTVLDPVDTFLNRMEGEDLLERAARHGLAAAQKDLSLYELAGLQQYGNYDNGPYIWLLLAQANGAAVSAAEIAAARDFLTEGAREDARATVQQALGKTRLPGMWPLVLDDDAPADIFDEELRAALHWQECARILSIIDDARRTGIAAADYELGVLYDEGTCVDQDAAKARDLYTAAVDGGAMQSALRLGLLFYDGRGGVQDLEEARFWFKAAALTSYSFAYSGKDGLNNLAYDMPRVDNDRRREPPPELVAEFEWVAEIEGGDPRILHETALRVRGGDGLPRDREAAERWLVKAGEQGVPEAYYDLGLTYLGAPIEPRDVGDGIFYLAMAGRDGFVPAQVEMGRRYAAGDQIQRWSQAAYVWLVIAADNGADVTALLDDIGGRLSNRERFTALEEADRGTYYPLRLP